jgi:hypothetical protein
MSRTLVDYIRPRNAGGIAAINPNHSPQLKVLTDVLAENVSSSSMGAALQKKVITKSKLEHTK